jgi:hypothetical protein
MAAASQTGKSSRKAAKPKSSPRLQKHTVTHGPGHFYHIQIRPSSEFVSFRTQDVGRKGHIQRVAGRRPSGSWATIKWLIAKQDAHVEGEQLVADTAAARTLIKKLGSTPVHTYGDRFSAKPAPRAREASRTPATAKARAQREPAKKSVSDRGRK